MDFVIDVEALEAVAREHSDNKHIIRRDDLKMGLISVRPHDGLPIHTHDHEDQLYYVLEGEGTIRMNDREFELGPGKAVTIPPGVAHGVRNESDKPLRYLDIFIHWKT
ncbi:MAG TPA: dimethylsulfonioproprionate lyase family protein [Anaerolineales bacterium]|nr:dimethylsulfonioproprionate lyase family protein [Anaerolineales bacterium]